MIYEVRVYECLQVEYRYYNYVMYVIFIDWTSGIELLYLMFDVLLGLVATS